MDCSLAVVLTPPCVYVYILCWQPRQLARNAMSMRRQWHHDSMPIDAAVIIRQAGNLKVDGGFQSLTC